MRQSQRVADAAHGPDEADRGDRPRDVTDQRQLGVETLALIRAHRAVGGGRILHAVGRLEARERLKDRAREQEVAQGRLQCLERLHIAPGVFGQDLDPLRQWQQLVLEQPALAQHDRPFVAEYCERPQHENETGFLLVILEDHVDRALDLGVGLLGNKGALLSKLSLGVGPHHADIGAVHKNRGEDQGEDLINELDRKVLDHESPLGRMNVGSLAGGLISDVDGEGNRNIQPGPLFNGFTFLRFWSAAGRWSGLFLPVLGLLPGRFRLRALRLCGSR